MGSAAFRNFSRKDNIPGQGKGLLAVSKLLKLKNIDLDRIFHEFCKYADPETNLADIKVLFRVNRLPYGLCTKIFFQVLDKSKSEHMDFLQFLVCFWSFLTLDEKALSSFCFSQFDTERSGSMEIKELSLLVHLIWEFKPNKKVVNAIKLLDLNSDGLITVAEFALLCKHQPLILAPLEKVQKQFRKRIVFTRFWKELTDRRYSDFQYQTIFDIIQIYDPSYVISSMEYMSLRPEIPAQFLEQYRFITQKKKLRRKGDIEMPYELKEGDANNSTYGFFKDSFVINDDDSKARGGWAMSRSRSRKVVDLMNADSFVSMT